MSDLWLFAGVALALIIVWQLAKGVQSSELKHIAVWLVFLSTFVAIFWAMLLLINRYIAASLGIPDGDAWVPYQSFVWSLEYFNYNPSLFQVALVALLVALLVCFAIARLLLWMFLRRAKLIPDLHGSAHWATPEELKTSGLLDGQGVYVGGWEHRAFASTKTHYLRHDGPEHALAFAPSRSGKGVGLVIPTLLSWPHSVVVYDPKGEAWAITAGWRHQHANNHVLKFQPESSAEGLATFNPLEEIVPGSDGEVAQAQNIAMMIMDPDGKGLAEHWDKTGFSLITGAILHCIYAIPIDEGRPANLCDVGWLFASPGDSMDATLQKMLSYPHLPDGSTHPYVAQEAQTMLNRDGREASSVLSTATTNFSLFRDPSVAKNTATSTFRVKDLMNAEQPTSLYLVVSPNSASRLRPLMRLIITQIVHGLTGEMHFEHGRSIPHYKHRLLLMLDEFATLKRLPAIEEGLAIFAGYGIKAYLIVQDLNQLWASYGKNEQLIGNCHVRIAFSTIKIETAEMISKMCGQRTVITKKLSVSGSRSALALKNVSESMQEERQALIRPEDVLQLKNPVKDDKTNSIKSAGELIVFIAGQAPIKGTQILYFKDPTFQKRSEINPPARSSVIRAPSLLDDDHEPR